MMDLRIATNIVGPRLPIQHRYLFKSMSAMEIEFKHSLGESDLGLDWTLPSYILKAQESKMFQESIKIQAIRTCQIDKRCVAHNFKGTEFEQGGHQPDVMAPRDRWFE